MARQCYVQRQLEKRLSEALDQQMATSETLRVIGSSPTEVQPAFDAILTTSAIKQVLLSLLSNALKFTRKAAASTSAQGSSTGWRRSRWRTPGSASKWRWTQPSRSHCANPSTGGQHRTVDDHRTVTVSLLVGGAFFAETGLLRYIKTLAKPEKGATL